MPLEGKSQAVQSLPRVDGGNSVSCRHRLRPNRSQTNCRTPFQLGKGLLEDLNAHLESQGLGLGEGTIVDASIIEAPSPTRNRAGDWGPDMHQTRRGNRWHFGRKGHIGVWTRRRA